MEMGKSPRGARTGAFNIGFLIFISGVERNGECDLLIFFFFLFCRRRFGICKIGGAVGGGDVVGGASWRTAKALC